jgi:hypothetical protein
MAGMFDRLGTGAESLQRHLADEPGEQQGRTPKCKVILAEQDGTWDIERQNVKTPCVGIRAPIVIKSVTGDALVFEIVRSRSLKGCKDNIATLQRVDENTLQGALDDGRTLTLTRE